MESRDPNRDLLPLNASPDSRTQPTAQSKTSGGRVLVMDDDPTVCLLLERMLKRLGCEAVAVADGADALAAYDAAAESGRPFRLVIMDLTVPGKMGGREAVGRLKEKHPDARVAVSSGQPDGAVLSAYADYGFDAVLSKPYRLADVSKLLA